MVTTSPDANIGLAPAAAATPSRLAQLLGVFEVAVAALVSVLMTGALAGPLLNPDELTEESAVLRLMWPPLYAAILLLSLWRVRRLARFWLPALMAMLLVGWAYASKSWSLDPDTTGRRVIALFMTTLFGVYLAAAFPGKRLVEFLGAVFLLMAALSLAFVLGYPKVGLHHDVNAGDWRGIWYEKNQMGAMMVIAALACICAARLVPRRRWLWLGGAVFCAGLLAMTHSATSAICLGLVVAGTLALLLVRRGPASAVATVWAGGTAALAGATAAWLNPDLLLLMLGKDPTLTGRTGIWDSILRRVAEQPWQGYGYAAFWGLRSPPAMMVRKETKWLVPSAHNGWLDLLVQVGLIGVGLFALVLLIAGVAALFRTRRLRDADFSLLYLIAFGVVILSESVIMAQNNMNWCLFVACAARALGPAPTEDEVEFRSASA